MKKKHRDITVNDVQYAWTLKSEGKEKYVTIWQDKKQLFTKMFRVESVTPKDVADTIKAHLKLDNMSSDSLVRVEEKVKYFAIIKKGTKNDPVWLVHCDLGDQVELCQEDDNLPDFQPYPKFIDKDELDEMGGELVEIELKIL
jgi:hypothetical protein